MRTEINTIIMNQPVTNNTLSVCEYRSHKAWSKYLEKYFGSWAALSFAFGSDALLNDIEQDLSTLKTMPAGAHLSDIVSALEDMLPPQFTEHYDSVFLAHMKDVLISLLEKAGRGESMVAHTVLEELLIYLCNEETIGYLDATGDEVIFDRKKDARNDDWLYDLFDDMDIVSCLYSGFTLPADHIYHFIHWDEMQFYTKRVCQ